MAPIKIKHIVSFSSQDPKHPVENLLSESGVQPWLICPQDRSRQLKVELQLERACLIEYIDIGNSGSAFLQIDVGRSSWPLDKPFVTMIPMTTMMNPADSKLGKNRNGVRMFKEGDFLAGTAREKWDRLRISCSQPFNKDLFGLSFLRLRSPLDEEDPTHLRTLVSQMKDSSESSACSPQRSPPAFRNMFMKSTEELNTESQTEQDKLNGRLHQVLSGTSPREIKAFRSRTALMVLSATKSLKRRLPKTTASPSPPHNLGTKSSKPEESKTCPSPMSSGSCPDTSVTPPTPHQKESTKPGGRRRLRMPGPSASSRRQPHLQEQQVKQRRERDSILRTDRSPETEQGCSSCPICGGYFRVDYLPTHASRCGEDVVPQCLSLSSDDSSSDDDIQLVSTEQTLSMVPCPLCGFQFWTTEIERHASSCGE